MVAMMRQPISLESSDSAQPDPYLGEPLGV